MPGAADGSVGKVGLQAPDTFFRLEFPCPVSVPF